MPIHVDFEKDGLPAYAVPEALVDRYGGTLGFEAPVMYANFVSSLDGVAAIAGVKDSPSRISGHSDTDRFIMGLLRACADAVLIGAGTLSATPRALWTPAAIYPDAGADYAQFRDQLGREPDPRLVIVSAKGDLDPSSAALEAGALVLTTARGAAALGSRLPSATIVEVAGESPDLAMSDVRAALARHGHDVVLAEGGPHVIGQLFRDRLLDELFLTISPILAGAGPTDDRTTRPGFVQGTALLPDLDVVGDLLSVRRDGSHLYLRYAFDDGHV